ncbi:MAG: hypothetical protein AB8B73_08535 [Ekhidna sp.]
MNQFKFYVSLMGIFFLGLILVRNDIPNYGFIVFFTACLVIGLRRVYLKLTPWWNFLRDVPKYFKEP